MVVIEKFRLPLTLPEKQGVLSLIILSQNLFSPSSLGNEFKEYERHA